MWILLLMSLMDIDGSILLLSMLLINFFLLHLTVLMHLLLLLLLLLVRLFLFKIWLLCRLILLFLLIDSSHRFLLLSSSINITIAIDSLIIHFG